MMRHSTTADGMIDPDEGAPFIRVLRDFRRIDPLRPRVLLSTALRICKTVKRHLGYPDDASGPEPLGDIALPVDTPL